jgi:hypothetical protein
MNARICLLLVSVAATVGLSGCDDTCEMPMENGGAFKAVASRISGHVYDMYTGDRVPFATVVIQGTQTQTTTDSLGEFIFTDLAQGSYIFHVQKANLGNGWSQSIEIAKGDSMYALVGLRPVAGNWSLTVAWDGRGSFGSTFELLRDRTLKWYSSGETLNGTWSMIGDTLSIDAINGTMLDGFVKDSASGLVDQRDYPIDGTFVATR